MKKNPKNIPDPFSAAGMSVTWQLEIGNLHDPAATLAPEQMREIRTFSPNTDEWIRTCRGCALLGDGFLVTEHWKRHSPDRWAGRIEFSGNTGGLYVEKIHFPVVKMPFPASGIRLLVGVSQGWVYRFEADHADGVLAAHHFSSLQLCAALTGTKCYYFDCRDLRDHLKSYSWHKKARTLEYHVEHPCPCAPRNRRAGKIAFDNSVAVFPGDWYEAAQVYRAWALTTPRYRKRIRNNPQRETAIWLWNRGGAEHVIAPAEKLARDSGVPVALDWYWWHGNPYDTNYPDFWPPREGEAQFRKAVARLNSENIYCQVYVNGLTWDVDLPDYARGGRESAVVNRDGSPHAVEFNCYTHHKLGYMCGEGSAFQARIRELVARLADCGLPGVYLDMIGCAAVHPCYNPRHRHAPGGGTYQARGYRKLIADLRREHPQMRFSTECCNETFLNEFESAIILASSMERCGNEAWIDCVPAFSAVYHGATALFGNYALPDGIPPWDPLWPPRERWRREQNWDEKYPDQFYLELARTVIWGMQPTVCNFQMEHTRGRFRTMYDYIVRIARFYYEHRDFLYDGRLLAPGDFHCDRKSVSFLQRGLFTTEAKHTILTRELPAVLHSRWEAPDGRRALIMINYTGKPQTCHADGRDYSLEAHDCRCEIHDDLPAGEKNRRG